MIPKHVCLLCNVSFNQASDLRRHQRAKHDNITHSCADCGKSFNRVDNLRRHQAKCQMLQFKCPRSHRFMSSMNSLTEHMGLCSVPTCGQCQDQFVDLDQLKEHGRLHKKRKAGPSHQRSAKKPKSRGQFHCGSCLQSFEDRGEWFNHKLTHMEDARIFQPVQPHFDFEDDQLNQLLENNQDFVFGPHHFSPITSDLNFPITIPVSGQEWIRDIHLCLDSVMNLHQEESYKLNFTLGFILRHRETGEYRYFVPHSNNTLFSRPVRIDRPSSWREVFAEMSDEALTSYVTNHRQDTKWIPLLITNIRVQIYHLGITMGKGVLPEFITDSRVIVGLSKDRKGKPYDDNLCALRCLAFHINLQENNNGYVGLENKTRMLRQRWGKDGLDLVEVGHFEETFTIDVDIFTMFDDGSVAPRYLSENRYNHKMVLNLHENHLSYVTNPLTYLHKYRCDSCERHFSQLIDLQRHQGSCANATKFKFPGQAHKMTYTIFDRLEEFDIVVPPDERTYPWFVVYDFEAILSRLEEEPPTPQLKWLRRHDPISVSVASNVTGYSEPQGFVNSDPKNLIEDMMQYMGEIVDHIYDEAEKKWKYVFEKLEEHLEEMAGYGLGAAADDDDKTNKEEEGEDGETISQVPMTEEEITDKEWRRTYNKLVKLQQSFIHYCRQVPVLGFNSARYDLNLVKSYLIPWLQNDGGSNSDEMSTDLTVIKKGSTYTQIGGRRFKFMDVINYLAGGFSYDKFLKAYKIAQTKSYFPYEWFDHIDKLNYPCLPGYDAFYSELKRMNVLEVKEMGKAVKTGPERYQELQQIWQDHNMTTTETSYITITWMTALLSPLSRKCSSFTLNMTLTSLK